MLLFVEFADAVRLFLNFRRIPVRTQYFIYLCIRLDASNIFEFPLKWQKEKGLDPVENSSHLHYLENLCDKMVEALMKNIDTVSEAMEWEASNEAYFEAVHHSIYCREKAGAFMVMQQYGQLFGKYVNPNVADFEVPYSAYFIMCTWY